MVKAKPCINVYSEMNPWIDFCVVLENEKDIDDATKIVEQAYNEWFLPDNATDLPITEYISNKLTDACIWHEIYFTDREEEDYE